VRGASPAGEPDEFDEPLGGHLHAADAPGEVPALPSTSS
jgi:hypothetical protein